MHTLNHILTPTLKHTAYPNPYPNLCPNLYPNFSLTDILIMQNIQYPLILHKTWFLFT